MLLYTQNISVDQLLSVFFSLPSCMLLMIVIDFVISQAGWDGYGIRQAGDVIPWYQHSVLLIPACTCMLLTVINQKYIPHLRLQLVQVCHVFVLQHFR